ncbi:hypothetical protein JYK14_05775 [Siccirubricoccus sp. KC 17139]|uniref:DUF3566 domain-containing protein n=1 Tax=Siccirubricoccus soli TaxID=2899147 RepID=A0ABT1D193_9PROT|nr:hypothetical protein [Siccirubricoccus soli]MCO6415687.1 hypothetical protein [Siccirubricoccus soli]MCP2681819.1 hypothetical protein [Siccirubricoccus soli]
MTGFAELGARPYFSLLDGASLPHELVATAMCSKDRLQPTIEILSRPHSRRLATQARQPSSKGTYGNEKRRPGSAKRCQSPKLKLLLSRPELEKRMSPTLLPFLESKLTVRAVLAVSSLFTAIFGCYLVLSGIKDDGFIDLKTTFLEGRLKSGMAGITIIFLSVIQGIFLIIGSGASNKHRVIEISINERTKISITGVHSMRETIERLTPVIRGIVADERKHEAER